jgi:hypothetical protein
MEHERRITQPLLTSPIWGRVQPVGKRLNFLFRIIIERRLSPTKRTEKTGLEHVDLAEPCRSANGHERAYRLTGAPETCSREYTLRELFSHPIRR